ncbi:MAG: glycosyltransferase [Pseudomonadota bacterium]
MNFAPLPAKSITERPLRILFGSAHPYLPQMIGGAQTSTHQLVERLRERGHQVAVLAGLTGEGWLGVQGRIRLKLGRKGYVCDTGLGYPVFRAWFAERAVADVVARFRADVAVFQSRLPVQLAAAIDRRKVRTFLYLRNVETKDLGGALADIPGTRYIANSHFTARRFSETDGIESEVIYPLIAADRYAVTPTRKSVTFINPHPDKGADLAFDLARACPELPFTFVRGWGLSDAEEAHLQRRLAETPNVTLLPSTDDMRSVYGDARIVLAPSQWEEAFGRVVAEAQVSGIPVLASDIGGLPEAVGPGGVLLPPDAPVSEWADALRGLWNDEVAYEATARAALTHASRPDLMPDYQIDRLLRTLGGAPVARAGP